MFNINLENNMIEKDYNIENTEELIYDGILTNYNDID